MTTRPPVQFSSPTYDEWKAAAEALLKGTPFDKVMLTRTPEGITLQPIYRQEVLENLPAAATLPGADGFVRGTQPDGYRVSPWAVAQELPHGEAGAFNAALLADLSRGQDCVNVQLDAATAKGRDPDAAPAGEVGVGGLSLACLADVRRAFQGVMPEAVSFHFQSGCGGLAVEALFLAWLHEQQADLARVRGGLNMDPLGTLSAEGVLPAPLDRLYDELADLAAYNAQHLPLFTAAGPSGLPAHSAGASAVQELGILLATGLAYLRALAARGLTVADAARQIRFTFALGPDFFMELAKLRAARPLWARIVRELGGDEDAQRLRLHARTGLYNKTRHDPYVNLLRTTTEALSGVLGGVDSLCVGTFDECLRLPDDFARRIARNTQIILQEECELTSVVDPAGGSWFVESLTDDVARTAWGFFRAIEKEGGMAAALASGFIRKSVAAVHEGKEKLLSQRRLSLVGTNQYPNLAEKLLPGMAPGVEALATGRAQAIAAARTSRAPDDEQTVRTRLASLVPGGDADPVAPLVEACGAGATVGEITRALRAAAGPGETVAPLPRTRLAMPYEELRAAAQEYARAHGHPPRIHLATLGALRRHKARADFTRGFFGTGGFEVVAADGSTDPAEVAARAAASGASLVVLCGSDEDYPALVPDVVARIKETCPGATVLLAGHPGDHEAAYRQAGMDDFITIKSNNHETNLRFLRQVGALPADA